MKPLHFHFSNKKKIVVNDFVVSSEEFTLKYDNGLQLYKTFPVPSEDKLWEYYPKNEYISHKNEGKSMFEKLYFTIKKFYLKRKYNWVSYYHPEPSKVLDFGAGNGDFASFLQLKGWKSYVYEPSNQGLHSIHSKGLCVVSALHDVDDCFFDVITLWHSLEHVSDLEQTILELKRLLKPDGTIVIAVPNFKSFDAAYYEEYWAAFDVPRHIWHFSSHSISVIFEAFGMKVINRKGMFFDAFYVSILSERYKKSFLAFPKGVLIGLISNIKGRLSGEYSSLCYFIRKH